MRRPLLIIRFLAWLDERSVQRETGRDGHAHRPTVERCEERISPSSLTSMQWGVGRGVRVISSDSYVLF
jgi:hypothetical protein